MSYIDKLIDNCQRAKSAIPLHEFVMADISELKGIRRAIYVIEHDGDPEKVFLEFSRFKQSKARSCARLNAPSAVLYVGSSITNLRKRVSEHLGRGSGSTYALHLDHWFSGKYKITVKIYDEPPEVMQIIEDDLSDILKPAFGKQGGNSK